MGYAIAGAARDAGAKVQLVSGPTALEAPPGVDRVPVVSARDMYEAVMSRAEAADIFIGAAAVADYRPEAYSEQKIKKGDGGRSLALERTDDIIAAVSTLTRRPFTVGFAAETNDVEAHALGKLTRKSLDMIAANQVGRPGTGFASDENALSVYWSDGRRELGKSSKTDLAAALIDLIIERSRAKYQTETA